MTRRCVRASPDLWAQLQLALARRLPMEHAVAEHRYGKPILVQPRLGQGAFRLLVTDAYQRGCAVTGERTLPVLDAAHIRPYAELGPHRLENGILRLTARSVRTYGRRQSPGRL
jgi:putative restriction endonuclease